MLFPLAHSSAQTATKDRVTVSGWVSDDNGDPAVGAVIWITNTDTSILLATDQKGYFKFRTFSKQALKMDVSYPGYVSVEKLIEPEMQQLKIKLVRSSEWISNTVYSHSRSQEELKHITVSTDIIKPYVIENRGLISVKDVLKQLPSLSVIDGGVQIRSGSSWGPAIGSRVLVLVDDMPYISGDGGQVLWDLIPMENIGQIEVTKGASSVLYGSGALNGVIHIRSTIPKAKAKTMVTFQEGIYDRLPDPASRWTDKLRNQTMLSAYHSERIYNTDVFAATNFTNNLGYRLGEDDQRFRFSFGAMHRNQKIAGLSYGLNANFMQQIASSFQIWNTFGGRYVNLDSNKTIQQSRFFIFNPYLTYQTAKSKHQLHIRSNRLTSSIENTISQINQRHRYRTNGIEYVYSRFLDKYGSTIMLGLNRQATLSESDLYISNHRMVNMAPYAQLNWKHKKLNVVLGWRYEYYQMDQFTDDAHVLRAGLSYQLMPHTSIRTSFGESVRFPTIAERCFNTQADIFNYFSNPAIEAERGWTAEVGLKQGFKLGNTWSGMIDAAYFIQSYQNMIEMVYGVWGGVDTSGADLRAISGFKAFNTSDFRVDGWDFTLSTDGRITDDWRLRILAGYTYTNPFVTNPDMLYATDSAGTRYSYRSTSEDSSNTQLKYTFRHLFKYDIELAYKRYTIGISQRYHSFMTNIDGYYTQSNSAFTNAFPNKEIERGRLLQPNGTLITDLRVAYQASKKIRLQIIVHNLFNQEHMLRPADMRPTRLFMFQFQYAFQ